jgi:hypothetical protein
MPKKVQLLCLELFAQTEYKLRDKARRNLLLAQAKAFGLERFEA